MSISEDTKPRTCHICYKIFPTETSLCIHKCVNVRRKPFACNFCPHSFLKEYQLVRHLKIGHADQSPISNSNIEVPVYESSMKKRRIDGAKNFKCALCPKQFATRQTLRRHSLVHGKEINKCDKCQIYLANRDQLKNHFHTFHGMKKLYICSTCGELFSFKSTLISHQSDVHAKERPF